MKKLTGMAKKIFAAVFMIQCIFSGFAEEVSLEEAKEIRENFISEIKNYIGCPYVLGAMGPDAFDCSGLIKYAADRSTDLNLPRTAAQMYGASRIVSDKNREKGDLVFFKDPGSSTVSHVGVYIGNGQFISAISAGQNTGVIVSSLNQDYWRPRYFATGQILPSAVSVKIAKADPDEDFSPEEKANLKEERKLQKKIDKQNRYAAFNQNIGRGRMTDIRADAGLAFDVSPNFKLNFKKSAGNLLQIDLGITPSYFIYAHAYYIAGLSTMPKIAYGGGAGYNKRLMFGRYPDNVYALAGAAYLRNTSPDGEKSFSILYHTVLGYDMQLTKIFALNFSANFDYLSGYYSERELYTFNIGGALRLPF